MAVASEVAPAAVIPGQGVPLIPNGSLPVPDQFLVRSTSCNFICSEISHGGAGV
jgi:hypothetical protein